MKLPCSLVLLFYVTIASLVDEKDLSLHQPSSISNEHLDDMINGIQRFADFLLNQMENFESSRFSTTKLLNSFKNFVNLKEEGNELALFADATFDIQGVLEKLRNFTRNSLYISDLRLIAAENAKCERAMLVIAVVAFQLITRETASDFFITGNVYSMMSLANHKDFGIIFNADLANYLESIEKYEVLPGSFCSFLNISLYLKDESLRMQHEKLLIPLYIEFCDEMRFIIVRVMLETHQEYDLLNTFEATLDKPTRMVFLQEYKKFKQQRHVKIYAMSMSTFLLDLFLKTLYIPEDVYYMYAVLDAEKLTWNSSDFVKQETSSPCLKKQVRIYFLCEIKPPSSLAYHIQRTLVSGNMLSSLRAINEWEYFALAYSLSVIELEVEPFKEELRDNWNCVIA